MWVRCDGKQRGHGEARGGQVGAPTSGNTVWGRVITTEDMRPLIVHSGRSLGAALPFGWVWLEAATHIDANVFARRHTCCGFLNVEHHVIVTVSTCKGCRSTPARHTHMVYTFSVNFPAQPSVLKPRQPE